MTRIVPTTYRYKRPPQKRKAVAITGPAIVRKATAAGVPSGGKQKPEPAPPPPANDDRRPPPPSARKPAIVTATSRKRARPAAHRAPSSEHRSRMTTPGGRRDAGMARAREVGPRASPMTERPP